jgi:hypothetical protein
MSDLKITKSPHGENIEYHTPPAISGEGKGETKIHSVLFDVVVPLARRHPEWLFVSSEWGGTRFQVYEDKEHIGTITVDYRAHSSCVGITSERIRNRLLRDVMIRTSDAKKARKLVEANFSLKTPDERAMEAAARVIGVVNSLVNTASRSLMRADTTLSGSFAKFLNHHSGDWPEFAAFMRTDNPDLIESTRYLRKQNAELIRLRVDGTVVHLYGGNYLLRKPGAGPTTTLSEAALTPKQKTSIGLMKLSADGAYVPDVGVRAARDIFMVIDIDEPQT